jgi:hypothetical protein
VDFRLVIKFADYVDEVGNFWGLNDLIDDLLKLHIFGIEEGRIEDQIQANLQIVLYSSKNTTVGFSLTSQLLTMNVETMGKWLASL